MATVCQTSLSSAASLVPQARRGGLLPLRSTASLARRHSLLTLIPRCEASSSPSSSSRPQRVSGNLFKNSSTYAVIPDVILPRKSINRDDVTVTVTTQSSPESLKDKILSLLGQAVKPALASVLIAAVLWASSPGSEALAAQGGGRAGGKNFSASRARTYSPPPAQRYSGQSYSAPSPGYSVPFFAPSPFFSPFGFGFGPTIVVGGGGGFGFGGMFNFLLLSMVAVFVVSAILNFFQGTSEEEIWEAQQRSSIVRLQVGLMGSARQLQKDLERMASRADTSSPEGLHYVLQEAVLSLLRNPDYCIYGYSTSEVAKDSYDGEQAFNRLSLEERSKFKEETLVNVGDVRKRVQRTEARETVGTEYIVVTLIAATEGEFRLPEVKSAADLRTALTQLGSITSDELQAIEILWTPEDVEDTLTTKDMLQDYPLLRPL